jgi:hypothetical protein
MPRLRSKEIRHEDYHPETVLMTNTQRKTALLAAALAVPLQSNPTELNTQQNASPCGEDKPDGLLYVFRDSAKQ